MHVVWFNILLRKNAKMFSENKKQTNVLNTSNMERAFNYFDQKINILHSCRKIRNEYTCCSIHLKEAIKKRAVYFFRLFNHLFFVLCAEFHFKLIFFAKIRILLRTNRHMFLFSSWAIKWSINEFYWWDVFIESYLNNFFRCFCEF